MKAFYADLLRETTEKKTGIPVKKLQAMTVSEIRSAFDERNQSELSIRSFYPAIGRGNVLKDRIMSHQSVLKEFNKALMHEP